MFSQMTINQDEEEEEARKLQNVGENLMSFENKMFLPHLGRPVS
jgi:hypothetical protein